MKETQLVLNGGHSKNTRKPVKHSGNSPARNRRQLLARESCRVGGEKQLCGDTIDTESGVTDLPSWEEPLVSEMEMARIDEESYRMHL